MQNIQLSIIIINYNVKELLLKCLASVYNNTNPSYVFEVIVVDNASTDKSIEAVKEKFPQASVIENKNNLGFPAANNQGFRLAKGKYIFMLNPDTEIDNDTLMILSDVLNKNSDIALVAPKLFNTDGSLQYSAWRFPTIRYIAADLFYLSKLIGSKYYTEKNFDQPFEVDSVSGAAMFFRKELLDQYGFLNEKLFWIEDIDLLPAKKSR